MQFYEGFLHRKKRTSEIFIYLKRDQQQQEETHTYVKLD